MSNIHIMIDSSEFIQFIVIVEHTERVRERVRIQHNQISLISHSTDGETICWRFRFYFQQSFIKDVANDKYWAINNAGNSLLQIARRLHHVELEWKSLNDTLMLSSRDRYGN